MNASFLRLSAGRAAGARALDRSQLAEASKRTTRDTEAREQRRHSEVRLHASVESAGRVGAYLPDLASPYAEMVQAREELQFVGASCLTRQCVAVFRLRGMECASDPGGFSPGEFPRQAPVLLAAIAGGAKVTVRIPVVKSMRDNVNKLIIGNSRAVAS